MSQLNNTELGTGNLGSGQQLVKEMDSMVYLKNPHYDPITTILSEIGDRTVKQPFFEGEESPEHELSDTVNGASQGAGSGAGVAKQITMDNGDRFQVDFTVACSGINCIVTAISGNNVTFKPLNSGQTFVEPADGEEYMILGIAKSEGYALPEEFQSLRESRTGYIQEESLVFGITETLRMSEQYGSGAMKSRFSEELLKKTRMLRETMELTAIGGEKSIDTTGTHPKRTTDGIKGRVTTNAFNYDNGGITNANFRTISKTAFNNGSNVKYLFVSGDLSNSISNLLEATKKTPQTETVLGVKFTKYETQFGIWMIKYHPRIIPNALGFDGFYMDFKYMKRCMLKGSGLQAKFNVVRDGANKKIHEVAVKFGYDIAYEEAFGTLTES